jgi:hypothetical protein
MIEKRELLVHLDRGIMGSLVRIDNLGTEDGYSNIYFVPLMNSVFSKMHIESIRNVPNDCIHSVHSTFQDKGVVRKIIYIYTDEQNSIIKNIFNNTMQRQIDEYKETIKSLRKQITASKQEATDARSGVNKTMESINALNKNRRNPFGELLPPRPPFGLRTRGDFGDLDGEGDY